MMTLAGSLIVTEYDSRGKQKGNRCFYCPSPIGSEHDPKCVCRKKIVMVRMVAEFPIAEVESSGKHFLEFRWNDSSSCCSNIVDNLCRLVPIPDGDDEMDPDYNPTTGCLCRWIHSYFVRDATIDDLTGTVFEDKETIETKTKTEDLDN